MIEYKFLKERTVGIVGVSVSEGQDLSGPELAPKYLRENGLFEVIKSLDWSHHDYGDITAKEILEEESNENERKYLYSDLKHAHLIGSFSHELHETTKAIAESGQLTLTLGGDHGLATGSISGLKAVYPDLKIIWVDAHGDCNTPETSPSGNYHGMPVAHLLGWLGSQTIPGFDWFSPCLNHDDIVFIGLRDLDVAEKKNLKKHQIKCFTMHDVHKYGISTVMEKTFEYLFKDGKQHPIHISFDIDGVDPQFAPGTGTKARGGLLYGEAHYLVRETAATGCLVGLDMVEINPLLDKPREHLHGDSKHIQGTETVALGLELIASSLGHTLL